MVVLTADIGGTKTIIQLVRVDWTSRLPHISILAEKRYLSSDFNSFESLAKDFLALNKSIKHPGSACIAVAGPVEGTEFSQMSKLTNLSWELESNALSKELDIERFRIINDFEAIAYGVGWLDESSLSTIQPGILSTNNTRLVVGAGTGLGVCLLVWNGQKYIAIPTEGGHVGFSPSNKQQDLLHQELRNEFGRTSVERVVSGPGIELIYWYLCNKEGLPNELGPEIQDLSAAIAKHAQNNSDSTAAKAITLFVQCYGSFIGDAALGCLASGGVFIAGGIAPKLIWRLTQPDFIESIRSKGRMARIINKMPISVVLNQKVGLIGAAVEGTCISE